MGLDMYLRKQYYVQNLNHMEGKDKHQITILKGGKPSPIPADKITYIITSELYWRKANAIHKWFVNNVQNGKDDCGIYGVSREQLKQLLDTVTKVLENSILVKSKVANGYKFEGGEEIPILEDGKCIKNSAVAQELLPTTNGFFFGGTDYDQYYYEDLEYTKKELERVLATDDGGYFQYCSSW